jgi:hypothetical protein
MNPDPVLTGSGLFSEVGSGSGPNRSGSATLRLNPGPLMTGSKGLTHWTSEIVCKCSEIAGSPKGSPPAVDYVGCEAGGREGASNQDRRAV